MDRETFNNLTDAGLFGSDTDEVVIKLDQGAVGPSAACGISQVADGFDWDAGRVMIEPDEPLVSWSYLEKYYPGIHDEISRRVHDYSHRPLRVIVAGSRSYGNTPEERENIKHHMESLVCPPYVTADKVEVVSGCARGVDSAGAWAARELGYAVKEFPADWEAYGKPAGIIRNRQMAEYASEDLSSYRGKLIAFWDGESSGTKNMISLARSSGLEVTVVDV